MLTTLRVARQLGRVPLYSRRRLYATHNDGWETVIGLEIHAQLRTGSKLFSGMSNPFGVIILMSSGKDIIQ
jgi:hypothetical protein